MKRLQIIFTAFFLLVNSASNAYQECNEISFDQNFKETVLKSNLQHRIPVRYLKDSLDIRLNIASNTDAFFPTTYPESNLIVLSQDFLKLACQLVLTEFLYINDIKLDIIDQSARNAATCLEQNKPANTCLMTFGQQRASAYKESFNQLPEQHKVTALGLFKASINQILIHEYAHIFLDHLPRINQGKVKRIDAEFEADFFAVINGVQEAEPASAMYYFFQSIADIQYYTNRLDTDQYESGQCRTENVENITNVFGIEPILIVDASAGGERLLRQNGPKSFRQASNNRLNKPPTFNVSEQCGRLSRSVLLSAYDELRKLYDRVDSDIEFLFSKNKNADIKRTQKYLSDLSQMSLEFKHINGLAAKSVAVFLRSWNLKGNQLTPIIGQVDNIVNLKEENNNFLSGDMGRILLARGLAVLQEQNYLPRKKRFDQATRILNDSVYYNPMLSAVWMNLAFIALENNNCAQAEKLAVRSLETLDPSEKKEPVQAFINSMREASSNSQVCKRIADNFIPYPGL